jgi:predicted lipoprotein with Yx(FWY)xxD motif
MLKPNIKLISSIAITTLLTACGGGGKDYNPTPSSNYSSTAYNSTISSSSVAMSSSMPALSSAASSIAVSEAPIDRLATHIGLTWVAKGSVDVLVPSGTDLLVGSQNKDQLTLYVFDNDVPGQSACTSTQCLTTWPPLLAKNNDVAQAPLSIITRGDGHKQWALRDKPLYFYVGDAITGDIKGEGIGAIWHVALTEPMSRKPPNNDSFEEYLIASGKVLVGIPNSGSFNFIGRYRNRDGFSLYTFDDDTYGVSNCNNQCLTSWPPLLAEENDIAAPPYSIIDRSMGTNPSAKQWAYYGQPLYFYAGDTTAGNVSGEIIPKWHLLTPKIELTKSTEGLGSFLVASGVVEVAVPVNGVETTSRVARDGFTLYTFDDDKVQNSSCTDTCLTNWPALMIPPFSSSEFTYREGGEQLTFKGKPLYFFAGDTQPGQTNGEGVGGKWVVARAVPVAVKNHPSKGKIFIAHGDLSTGNGIGRETSNAEFTLYTLDSDPIGQSTCVGDCLTTWPPFYASSEKPFGDFTVITRDIFNSKQWVYKGKPLYFYSGDSAAGDVNGEYAGGTIARP